MNKLRAISNQTPVGEFWLICKRVSDIDIVRLSGFGDLKNLLGQLPLDLQKLEFTEVNDHPYQKFVAAYFAGDDSALDKIPRHQSGSPFANKIWQTMSQIPYGQTVSYQDLAKKSGNPGAMRAAGTVCGQNKLVLLIPCHRIIKSDKTLGSYFYGAEMKKQLLDIEIALSAKK